MWEQIFMLSYHSKGGLVYNIADMTARHRDWTTKRLTKQLEIDAKNEMRRAAGYKKGLKRSRK